MESGWKEIVVTVTGSFFAHPSEWEAVENEFGATYLKNPKTGQIARVQCILEVEEPDGKYKDYTNPDQELNGISQFLEVDDRYMKASDSDYIDVVSNKIKWYVVRSDSGKYADGFYGWDGNVHSDHQVFHEDELPYMECPEFQRIVVAESINKPSIEEVVKFLKENIDEST